MDLTLDDKQKNLVDDIIKFEGGEMDKEETIEFFQGLIDTGMVGHLQGSYGRLAANLIENGYCYPRGWPKSRTE